MIKSLSEIINIVGETNEANGFNKYSEAREAGYGVEYLSMKDLLEVSELTEAQDELRSGHAPDEVYLSWPATPASLAVEFPSGGDATEYFQANTPGKPEGYLIEKLDAIIRGMGTIYEIAESHGLDIEEVEEMLLNKVRFNASRGKMHGGKKF